MVWLFLLTTASRCEESVLEADSQPMLLQESGAGEGPGLAS